MKRLIYILLLLPLFTMGQDVFGLAVEVSRQQAGGGGGSTFTGTFEFPFQGNLTETTGNHPATNINGTMTYTTGPNAKYSQAADFDGTDYFDLAASADFSVTEFTIAFWAYRTTWDSGWKQIIQHDRFGSNWYGVAVDGDVARRLNFKWANAGFGSGSTRNPADLTDATWYHVVVTRESGTSRMFIDGVEVISVLGTTGTANLSAIRIGAITPSGEAFVGRLAGLQFWNTGKTVTECQQIYTDAQ